LIEPLACTSVDRPLPRPPGEALHDLLRFSPLLPPHRWIRRPRSAQETKMEFITQADKDKIQSDVRELHLKGKEIIERIAEARALGDLKENAEYHAAREDQGFNNERIKQLEERLLTAQVTDDMDIPDDVVFVGATVRLKELGNGDEDLYKIVGTASNDFSLEYIEVTTTSPLGSALMKARVGDIVRVDLPKGSTQFEILETL
jgi:transcription elongation factor GreA